MQYFIGIVPPDSYKEKVATFRGNWTTHWINKAVEPHITLKAQGGLTPDEKWISKVKKLCEIIEPFHITIGKPKFFFDNILYLSIESDELTALHKKLVQTIAPSPELIKRYFEMDDFIPHMSLGKTYYGMSTEELQDMARLAGEKITPYPMFKVDFIRIYREIEPQIYEKYIDIPLNH
ncbi:2'-5' RNA ligase family protein [Ornithinibacillus massiliensis]|uniref:2'-5' RNA ligase family protein n=1 Tax=Ornithinibacillus massiliensis TaxID=1944633 RepID=A0ABS5MG11_9BACI|nr:2'-5' RNA ligase family protein [Ornithinibacillus massiliensis]MBS3681281.1 2'-5' RNA ligase family protein [Ornithinibacillus massiliensis]